MLDSFFSIVTPELYGATFGSVSNVAGEVIYTFRGIGEFRVCAGSYVSTNVGQSAIKAATVLDIEAVSVSKDREGTWKEHYRTAAKNLMKEYKDLLPSNVKGSGVAIEIGDAAYNMRRLFNACLCNNSNVSSLPGPLALKVQKLFGGKMPIGQFVYICSEFVYELSNRITKVIGDKVKIRKEPLLVIPYHSSPATIAALEIIHSTKGKENDIVWIKDTDIAYSGMVNMKSESSIVLERYVSHAVRDYVANTDPNVSYTSVLVNPKAKNLSWIPESVYYVTRSDDPVDLLYPMRFKMRDSNVMFINSPHNVNAFRTWNTVAVGSIKKLLLREGDITGVVSSFINTPMVNNEVREAVIEELTAEKQYALADKFKEHTRPNAIWHTPSGRMYSTEDGYLWCDSGNRDVRGELITNFTLTPDYLITYETGAIFRVMNVNVAGDTRKVTIPITAFDTPKKLMEVINDHISLSGKPTAVIPTVYDVTRARLIILWVNMEYSKMDMRTGVSYLGWNPTYNNEFVGPGFVLRQDADKNVYEAQGCEFLPGVDYFKYFDPMCSVEGSNCTDNIPDDLMSLCKKVAGIVMRTYSGHPILPTPYSGDKSTREVIEKVFKYVGQKSLLQLNKNMRAVSQLDAVKGFPFAAQGYNRSQSKACKVGMILLGEEGPSIGEKTDSEIESAGRYLRYLVKSIPRYLMVNSGPSFLPSAEILSPEQLESEGEKLLNELN